MLIGNVVVRNEAKRFLQGVLEHTLRFVDFICLTDDDSTDETVDIARSIGGDRIKIQRLDTSLFAVNEAELRGRAWQFVEAHANEGDWIQCFDADELIWGYSQIPELIASGRYDVIGLSFNNVWRWDNERMVPLIRIDKAWKPHTCLKLFRYQPGGVYQQKKLACGSEPTYVHDAIGRRRAAINPPPLAIEHLGYMRDEDKLAKYDRYMTIDKGQYHSLTHLQSIVDPHPVLVPFTRFS